MASKLSLSSKFVYLVAILVLCSAFFYESSRAFLVPVGTDQSWYLLIAERMLHGAQLYGPEISETNPPFIIWASALPILLSRLLHAEVYACSVSLLLGCILVSSLWSYSILRRSAYEFSSYFLVLFSLLLAFLELWSGSIGFGQREHLFFLFATPYVLYAAIGLEGRTPRWERLLLGIVAACAVCFKPQQILVFLVLEVFLMFWTRSWRRLLRLELLTFCCSCVFYLGCIYLFAPLYLRETLPQLQATYWALAEGSAMQVALRLRKTYLVFVALALLAWLLQRRKQWVDARMLACLTACAFGALLAYAQQRVGWRYHLVPCLFFLFLAMAWIACRFLQYAWLVASRRRSLRLVAGLVLTVILLSLNGLGMRELKRGRQKNFNDPLNAFLQTVPPGTAVYIFSTDPAMMAEAYRSHLRWGSRFAHLWMLPALVLNETPAPQWTGPFVRLEPDKTQGLAGVLHADAVQDLVRWQPRVVLVQRCTAKQSCEGLTGVDFDMLTWFLRDRQFAGQWSRYTRQAEAPEGFSLYLRRGDGDI